MVCHSKCVTQQFHRKTQEYNDVVHLTSDHLYVPENPIINEILQDSYKSKHSKEALNEYLINCYLAMSANSIHETLTETYNNAYVDKTRVKCSHDFDDYVDPLDSGTVAPTSYVSNNFTPSVATTKTVQQLIDEGWKAVRADQRLWCERCRANATESKERLEQ